MKIRAIEPSMALPEGIIKVRFDGLVDPSSVLVAIGGRAAELVGGSPDALTVRVPAAEDGSVVVSNGESAETRIRVGTILTQDLHPVANPAVDSDGRVYVTYSGARGEQVAFGIFVLDPDGKVEPFLADIVNPTGLAMGPDGCLYISSRHSGEVYRSTLDKRLEKYIDGLGLATGLAFDSQGNLFVGDRGGTIYKVHLDRKLEVFCRLEASVSAYHLTVDRDDNLYVTGPTLATQDSVYRIHPDGRAEVYFKGLGRPQGLGFDPQGNLQVAASYRGRKGLFTLSENAPPVLNVTGPMLVGFAYSPDGKQLYCVDNSSLYLMKL